jgi:rRNA maturation protein Nop10
MKIHPWADVCANADDCIKKGANVYQLWNCQHCGAKQAMPDPNVFYMFGDCEECGKRTDIKSAGHNFRCEFLSNNKAMMDRTFGKESDG